MTIFFKGMLMGIADLVPGIYGGTIALITGIYEDLIEADGLYRELYDPDWAKDRNRKRAERIRQLAEIA